ncbi:4535_t:CDS:1, partial [Racocetra persica]
MKKSRSLQELSESTHINVIDDNQVISEEENYTESDAISNDNYYTDNATPDNE